MQATRILIRHPFIQNRRSNAGDWIFALCLSGFALTYLCSAGIERGLALQGGSLASAVFFHWRVRDVSKQPTSVESIVLRLLCYRRMY